MVEGIRMSRTGRQIGIVVVVVAALLTAGLALDATGDDGTAAAGAAEDRPNVVVIMTDDQDQTSVRVQPKLQKQIAGKGTTFVNNFASNPVCCPSRSTFFSGLYSHNTGVLRNSPPHGGFVDFDDSDTLAVWLEDSGYYTGLIGKYLNGYGSDDPTYIPPGWSEWYGATDPGTYRMYGYTLNENGTPITYGDYDTPDPALYQTDVYAEKAVDFIERRAPSEQPFFLEVAPLAPHTEVFKRPSEGDDDPPTPSFPNPRPAPRDSDAFAHEPLDHGPAFNERNVSDKPAPIRARPLMSKGAIGTARKRNRSRLGSLLAIDDMVAKVVRSLRHSGELDDTVIIYSSDNGFEQGQHRIPNGKQQPYEESLRVPLMIRGPGVPRDEIRHQLAANVDLAPTIAAIAGTRPGHAVDGESLVRDIEHPRRRDGRAIEIENWCQTNETCFDPELPRYRGVRTDRFKYVRYPSGEQELYDLARDPYEIKSRHGSSAYAKQRRALSKLLDRLELCAGGDCRIGPDVKLGLDYDRGGPGNGGACSSSRIVVTPEGEDGRRAIAAALILPHGKRLTDDERPIRFTVPPGALKGGGPTRLSAHVTALDGRVAGVRARAPRRC
jgi:N-acetylglucosamine-6-sulfatase